MSKSSPTYWSKAVSSAAITCLALVFLFSGIACVEVQDAASKLKDTAGAAVEATVEATADAAGEVAADAVAKVEAVADGSAGGSIKVGDKFPALNLKDQAGKAFDLAATLKKGPVALVIFRSADW